MRSAYSAIVTLCLVLALVLPTTAASTAPRNKPKNSGLARIYVMRPFFIPLPSWNSPTIKINGRPIGTLLPNAYLQVSRPAGTYTISVQHVGVEGRDETDLQVTAGATYYIAIGVRSVDTVGHQAVAQLLTAGFSSERLPSRSLLGGYVFYRIEPEAGAQTIKALKGR